MKEWLVRPREAGSRTQRSQTKAASLLLVRYQGLHNASALLCVLGEVVLLPVHTLVHHRNATIVQSICLMSCADRQRCVVGHTPWVDGLPKLGRPNGVRLHSQQRQYCSLQNTNFTAVLCTCMRHIKSFQRLSIQRRIPSHMPWVMAIFVGDVEFTPSRLIPHVWPQLSRSSSLEQSHRRKFLLCLHG